MCVTLFDVVDVNFYWLLNHQILLIAFMSSFGKNFKNFQVLCTSIYICIYLGKSYYLYNDSFDGGKMIFKTKILNAF